MINHIISKSSKSSQTSLVRKVIDWELCKKLKLDHVSKWYMHKPGSVLENETYKIFLDFEIKSDHLIPARWPDLVIVNNKEREPPDLPFRFTAG